jgi:heterodisulfide reductase subunit A-like polyferredoxin
LVKVWGIFLKRNFIPICNKALFRLLWYHQKQKIMNNKKIAIIGAGVSGLVAAIELEKEDFEITIIESSDRVGGRVKKRELKSINPLKFSLFKNFINSIFSSPKVKRR